MGIVDLLAIIPTYMMFIYPPIKYLLDIRIIRLIRIFRILKLTNYVRGAYTMQIALRSSRPKIIVFLLSIFIVVIIVGTLMYIIEGPADGFNNIAESIYWAIITLTTVGYGDIVTVTAVGKFCATSCEKLGPERMLIFSVLKNSLITSFKNSFVSISMPLEAMIICWLFFLIE